MEQNILNKILENTYTLNSLRKRVKILKTFLVEKFFGESGWIEKMNEQFNAEDILWFQNLNKDFFGQFNKDNIYSLFTRIEQIINETPSLIIYLPFEVNAQINTSIGQYIRKLFGKVLIFDIKFDPLLIAGCALSWQGIYKDYSLRKRIEDNKELLLGNFKKFLK